MVLMLLVVAVGVMALAQSPSVKYQTASLSPVYERWLNEDVAWIFAPEERDAFVKLRNDAERDHFVQQFWDRRDPTPGTTENEYKQEHYRRIAYSNEHFASKLPGWRTDRGKTYIVKGPPKEMRGNSVQGHPAQSWFYSIPGMKADVVVRFVDNCECDEYELIQ
jgi:GWxTD domain-containing protein